MQDLRIRCWRLNQSTLVHMAKFDSQSSCKPQSWTAVDELFLAFFANVSGFALLLLLETVFGARCSSFGSCSLLLDTPAQCRTSTKWSISPSRCRDHRQNSDMDLKIYHVPPPPHMGEKPHSRLQEMLLFFTSWKNRIVPEVPVSIGQDRGVPFSEGFSRTALATTKSAKVTRDNELTSQEEFFLFALEARPRHRRDPERAANIIFPVRASVLTAFVSIEARVR